MKSPSARPISGLPSVIIAASYLVAIAGCTDEADDALYMTFDERRLVCAASVDDWTDPIDWDLLQLRMTAAADNQWVLGLYAHTPGRSISMPALERILTMAEDTGLAFTRYRDLDATTEPFGGLLLSFDDHEESYWFDARDVFRRHAAKVTFFVTKYPAMPADFRAQLHLLYDDGHAIEAHGIAHLHAPDYVAEHGIAAYLADEVTPSFEVLRADGFDPKSYAYPYGERTDETDDAILPNVSWLRTTRGPCPY